MKKYYTPKKEKYHIGFEYEFSDDNRETWNKAVIKEGTQIDDIHREDRSWRVYQLRVKHLDKKDIESFGWNYVPDNSVGDGNYRWFDLFDGFNGWTLAFWKNLGENLNDMKNQIWNYKVLIQYNGKIKFEGIIKNKSELKDILIKTGVINE